MLARKLDVKKVKKPVAKINRRGRNMCLPIMRADPLLDNYETKKGRTITIKKEKN